MPRCSRATPNSTGPWVTDLVQVKGEGQDGEGVLTDWFNPDETLAVAIKVIGAEWQATANKALKPGGNWLRFKQHLADGPQDPPVHSDWAESNRFEVVPSKSASE